MSLWKFHLLSRSEPYFAGDKVEVACGVMVLKPITKGMIDDAPDGFLGFLGVCPKCVKAMLGKSERYLYAICEAQEAIDAAAGR